MKRIVAVICLIFAVSCSFFYCGDGSESNSDAGPGGSEIKIAIPGDRAMIGNVYDMRIVIGSIDSSGSFTAFKTINETVSRDGASLAGTVQSGDLEAGENYIIKVYITASSEIESCAGLVFSECSLRSTCQWTSATDECSDAIDPPGTFAMGGAVVRINSGETAVAEITRTSTVVTLAAIRYALTRTIPVSLNDIPVPDIEKLKAETNSLSSAEFDTLYKAAVPGVMPDQFVPANWSDGQKGVLDQIITDSGL
ncbi:MAG: hypothetical protein CVV49_12955 [Spirochaetae bacterium HGW-Spirochaetae-5]|nr:MAG: hypothetical protein CVV49_12955 [Spirochaetae bacterium HGW-Spirochaetae-5]